MDSDEELNTAAWAAMRGAVVGAAKVRAYPTSSMLQNGLQPKQ